jgi:proteasome lid subunit RPN8/RPN11
MKRKINSSSKSSSNSRSKTYLRISRSRSRSSKSSSRSSSSRKKPLLISTYDLEGIYAEIEDRDDEVCGFLKRNKENKYLKLDEQENITKDFSRKSCQTKKYSKMIYHTHPSISKSYPSVEDIIKIIKLKNKIIKISIIFTVWGIWQLSCTNKSDNIPVEIENKIRDQLANIYHNQNKGRGELRDKKLLQKSINNINKILSEYNFEMRFSEWNFENDFYLS